ncbi:hypothetical protein GSY69_05150 [Brevibacterium sp. 5221]|uniref:Uncharacterized protein n=1 Tax=Brevibacterium rongguiense TaxID=2695267 RepID=A0A6N9H5N2_9MICO|nr:hypothetical protein [Brevibacterium rongguiense]MYM19370.1 hypothetical protein [Brevibacterium rongguiense]
MTASPSTVETAATASAAPAQDEQRGGRGRQRGGGEAGDGGDDEGRRESGGGRAVRPTQRYGQQGEGGRAQGHVDGEEGEGTLGIPADERLGLGAHVDVGGDEHHERAGRGAHGPDGEEVSARTHPTIVGEAAAPGCRPKG